MAHGLAAMTSTAQRILNAADRIHRSRGLDALSIRAIADAIGVTPMAIYRHYRDKGALIDALVASGFARWERRLARAIQRSAPMEQLRGALRAYREFAIQEPRIFDLMFLIPRPKVPRAPASLVTSESPAFAALLAAVGDAVSEGTLPPYRTDQIVLLVWSSAHGLIALHRSGRFRGDDAIFRRTFSASVDALLEVLTAAADHRSSRNPRPPRKNAQR